VAFVGNHHNLVTDYFWAGTQLLPSRFLMHDEFADRPNEQFRTIILPPDPDPIVNARPEPYAIDEGLMPLTTEAAYPGDPGQVLRTETGEYIGVEPSTSFGAPTSPQANPFILGVSPLSGTDVLVGDAGTTTSATENE
jgi:hypothetical protein